MRHEAGELLRSLTIFTLPLHDLCRSSYVPGLLLDGFSSGCGFASTGGAAVSGGGGGMRWFMDYGRYFYHTHINALYYKRLFFL